ncbi:MAG: lipocalin family protein [Gammaproteobacteria bacterium]|nr:lipocalin family protein [Gammaproteobacteria bacterium]
MTRPWLNVAASAAVLLIAGCTTSRPPIPTVAHVDLHRFMGDWYVIAATPTFIDKNAYDAVESYRLAPDGTIETTYTFRDGAFDGPVKTLRPRARVLDRGGNARWGMQFLWPFRAQYLIAYVSKDYDATVIARDARDYVWIMARTPTISVGEYRKLRAVVGSLGYDVAKLRLYPQRWPAKR